MKSKKRHITEGIELPNQGKIGTLGKRKLTNTCKYWKRTQSKGWRWKEKKKEKKSNSGERENKSKSNYIADEKDKHVGCCCDADKRKTRGTQKGW